MSTHRRIHATRPLACVLDFLANPQDHRASVLTLGALAPDSEPCARHDAERVVEEFRNALERDPVPAPWADILRGDGPAELRQRVASAAAYFIRAGEQLALDLPRGPCR